MKKIILIIVPIIFCCIKGFAQQYIIINGERSQQKEQQWHTIETNNSDKYPFWRTFFANGVIINGRGEYLTDKLVNIETNNSDKYPIWKVYNNYGELVSFDKGYVASSGLINIETNNSERYPIWKTFSPEGRFISNGRSQ